MTAAAPRWLRPPGEELVWETIGQANFIYHEASGQTHFLNELAAWILNRIGASPQSCDDIRDALLTSFGGESSAELVASIEATVQVLAGFGLIVKASQSHDKHT